MNKTDSTHLGPVIIYDCSLLTVHVSVDGYCGVEQRGQPGGGTQGQVRAAGEEGDREVLSIVGRSV